jgi:hypothetical protein
MNVNSSGTGRFRSVCYTWKGCNKQIPLHQSANVENNATLKIIKQNILPNLFFIGMEIQSSKSKTRVMAFEINLQHINYIHIYTIIIME